jgi:hypothetical protein
MSSAMYIKNRFFYVHMKQHTYIYVCYVYLKIKKKMLEKLILCRMLVFPDLHEIDRFYQFYWPWS